MNCYFCGDSLPESTPLKELRILRLCCSYDQIFCKNCACQMGRLMREMGVRRIHCQKCKCEVHLNQLRHKRSHFAHQSNNSSHSPEEHFPTGGYGISRSHQIQADRHQTELQRETYPSGSMFRTQNVPRRTPKSGQSMRFSKEVRFNTPLKQCKTRLYDSASTSAQERNQPINLTVQIAKCLFGQYQQ